jgi:diketogulonate reductase-like aldo/keto reductase
MTAPTMRAVTLPDGTAAPALGMGSWYLGEDPDRHDIQLDALRAGIDIGLTLIDTAEMYGDGAAEELVGQAIAGRRDDVFLVSKVLPHHATRQGTVDACQRSLRRLGTDRLDLYLLHWRGRVPVEETVAAFETLVSRVHVIENRAALEIGFSQAELDQLDRLFPPPDDKVPLDVL